jgi:hypothetical protein
VADRRHGTELRAEHFGPDALADIAYAGSAVIAVVADVDHHHNADGGWDCWTDNPVEEIRLVRDVITQIEDGLREAKRRLADVERPARLAAARRARRGGPGPEPEVER